MTGRKYLIYDVFTVDRLAGNPLAIVLDSEGLDSAAMQKIAREFNLSESVFVLPADNPKHRARIRIFTPDYEMPFAGHPTVGSAVALSELDGAGDSILVLEENIGPIRCAVTAGEPATFAEFDLAKLPERLDLGVEPEAIGAALGLGPHELGFENHHVAHFSAGVSYVTIPVANLAAAGKVSLDPGAWASLAPRKSEEAFASAYIYCRETVHHDSDFHARMISVGPSSREDPATGSAAAAFAGTVMHFDGAGDGTSRLWIEQGIEMERPSRIRLELQVSGGTLTGARIGGHAVKVAKGTLTV